MYCRNCGEILLEDDRFCSKCGKQVIKINSENGVDQYKKNDDVKDNIEKKNLERLDINWNLSGFPDDDDDENNESEDIEFSWGTTVNQVKETNREPIMSPFTWNETEKTKEELAIDDKTVNEDEPDNIEVSNNINVETSKDVLNELDEVIEVNNEYNNESTLEDDLFSEMGSVEKSLDGTNVDKFFTYNKKIEEYQKIIDEEYDKLQGDRIPVKTAKNEKPIESPIKITLESVEEAAIEEEAIAEETLEEEVKTIPLINLKVESKINEKEIEEFKSIVEDAKTEKQSFEPKTFEEILMGDSNAQVDRPTLKFAPKIKETIVAAEEGNLAVEDNIETLENEQLNTGDIKNPPSKDKSEGKKATFDDVFNDSDTEDDEDNKETNKILKIILWILVIVLVLEIAILGVKKFMPDTEVAKAIVSFEDKYFSKFFEKDEKKVETPEIIDGEKHIVADYISNSTAEKNNIGEIIENADLKLVANKDYKFDEVNFSKPLIDSELYKVGDKSVTYGQVIVDTVIGYFSNWVGNKNGDENNLVNYIMPNTKIYENAVNPSREEGVTYGINHLEIGEILKGETSYYVFTKVTYIDSKNNKEVIKNKMVRMEALEVEMKISDIKSF